MSTLWWLVVVWLATSAGFVGGYLLRHEFEVWGRRDDYVRDIDLSLPRRR